MISLWKEGILAFSSCNGLIDSALMRVFVSASSERDSI